MALDFKKIALALVVKAYNVTTDRAAEILNDADEDRTDNDAITDILELNKAKIKETRTKAFDDGHKKATAEAMTAFEQSIRDEYEVSDTTLKGADLIKSVVQSQNKQEGNGTPLTEDAVKKHPLYIQLQDEKKAAVKKVTEELTQKVTEVEKGYKQKETLTKVKEEAVREFLGLNPILPEDATLATNQQSLFVQSLITGKNFEIQNGRTVILDETGKVLEDDHGNAITLKDLVKTSATQTFAFKKTDVGGNSGNNNKKPGEVITGVPQFKNEDAYIKYATDPTVSLADRTAAAQAWETTQAAQASE